MSNSPISVILVGCGAVSQLFYAPALRVLQASGDLQVVALVDPAASARNHLAASFPSAQQVRNLDDAHVPQGALAIIASPPRLHADQTLAAFNKGWHVLCEKPMAVGSAEAECMIAAADAAGLTLAVGHYKRFFPSSQQIKALCSPIRPLGALRHFEIAEGGPFKWPAASPSFFRKAETPGGVLLDIGVHVLDLLLWWLGDPTDFSYADDAMGGLETNASISLRFGTVAGTVRLSRDWNTVQRYDFHFERGRVEWTVNDANGLTLWLDGTPAPIQGTLVNEDGSPARTNPESFIAQLQHVAASIRSKQPVLVDGRAGARALRLIEQCYARKHILAQPWMSAEEQLAAAKWEMLEPEFV